MSNHTGGYMLNEVLHTLKENGMLDNLTKEKKRAFAQQVLEIGRKEDCNDGEILEGIAKDFGICIVCGEDSEEFKNDCCTECYEE